jgi:hypothetical protein
VPKVNGGHHGGGWTGGRGSMDIIEITGAIEACDLLLGSKVLHREAKGVKFNRDKIIGCKFANRN